MAEVRSKQEIEIMRKGGELLARGLQAAVDAVRPGIELRELDQIAETVLRAGGGEPSFKGYQSRKNDAAFPSTVCISVNEEVVHGPGSRTRVVHDGDIVGLDIGVWYEGMCTDMAVTVPVGKVSDEVKQLLEVTRQSMLAGIGAVRGDVPVSAVGKAVEELVKPYGYGIVRDLVGHGVGKKVHEDPHVPNFYDPRYDKIFLKTGMTIAVEPMITMGDWRVNTLDDGWTIVTEDGSWAAHFEVTILVTDKGYELITPLIKIDTLKAKS
ncbi:MAG: type I methionyl aminopeptidase [bacterium]|nr:type I methionyl aminopeptidase [bacterium]